MMRWVNNGKIYVTSIIEVFLMDKVIMNSGDSSKFFVFFLQVLSLMTCKRVSRIESWNREKEKI